MGKTPETLDGKLLKVRENKVRRNAAKQGLALVKLWRHTGTYMLFADHNTPRGRSLGKSGAAAVSSADSQMTLAEVEAALEARQRRTPDDSVVVAGPW